MHREISLDYYKGEMRGKMNRKLKFIYVNYYGLNLNFEIIPIFTNLKEIPKDLGRTK